MPDHLGRSAADALGETVNVPLIEALRHVMEGIVHIIKPDGTRDIAQIIHHDGTQEWLLNGVRHREDGPAVIHPDGTQAWFLNGRRHREDGPAVIHPDGSQAWYLNGLFHREDGPAVSHPNGTQAWYLNGENLTNEVTEWLADYGFPSYKDWDDVQKVIFRLRWLG